MKPARSIRNSSRLPLLCTLLVCVGSARATSVTWDANTGSSGAQDGTGTWNTTNTNFWNGSSDVAWTNSTSNVAVFGAGSGAAGTVTVSTVTTNGITFNAAGSGSYTLSSGTITLGGTTPTITANVAATIGSNLVFSGGTITKAGTGTLSLSGNNSGVYRTIISAGVLRADATNAIPGNVQFNGGVLGLGAGDLTMASGSLPGQYTINSGTSGGFAAYGADRTVTLTGGLQLAGTATSLTLGAADSTNKITVNNDVNFNGAVRTINVYSGTGSVDAEITGHLYGGTPTETYGGLNKTGDGTLLLSGDASYKYGTTVTAGTLLINGNQSAATGAVTVDGYAKLGGTGTIGGATTIQNHGVLAPGGSGISSGNLSFSSTVAFQSGSIFEWDLTSYSGSGSTNRGAYDQVNATGAVTGTGIFNIVLGGGSFSDSFWTTNKTWTNIFTDGSGSSSLASIFASFSGAGVSSSGVVAGMGQFVLSGNTLQWYTAVPEPTSALAGLLLGVGLLLRRRRY